MRYWSKVSLVLLPFAFSFWSVIKSPQDCGNMCLCVSAFCKRVIYCSEWMNEQGEILGQGACICASECVCYRQKDNRLKTEASIIQNWREGENITADTPHRSCYRNISENRSLTQSLPMHLSFLCSQFLALRLIFSSSRQLFPVISLWQNQMSMYQYIYLSI